jgi:hypothetical protein
MSSTGARVRDTNSGDRADFEVDLEIASISAPTGSPMRAYEEQQPRVAGGA